MDHFQNWFGLGIKGGGTLGIAGFETMEGYISNLGYPKHSHELNLSSLRLGVGLGASVGMTAILVFNCGNLQNMNETQVEDWSINISYGEKWSDIAKALVNMKFFATAAKLISWTKATPKDIDTIRNAMSYIYTTGDMIINKPQLVAIDIPGTGIGLEGSIQKLYGTITIGEQQTLETATETAPSGVKRGTI
jgi:hypothetical protein